MNDYLNHSNTLQNYVFNELKSNNPSSWFCTSAYKTKKRYENGMLWPFHRLHNGGGTRHVKGTR